MKRLSLSILGLVLLISFSGCSATGRGYSQSHSRSSGSIAERLKQLEDEQDTARAVRQLNSMGYHLNY